MLPFWLRRQALLARNLLANRERPNLDELGAIDDAEDFIWAVLPHAARTFSACIALMPRRTALPSGVAYLYCRMLDTYEDLVPDRVAREAALRAFAERLSTSGDRMAAARPIESPTIQDERDRVHLLLVERAALIDKVFLTFDAETRGIIRDLVVDMADGMCWSSETFATQGGVLVDDDQLATYCGHVLGNPTVFGIRILRLHYGRPTTLAPRERVDAMEIGEFVQLANVTRDVEKDLRRGIAYDRSLKADLWRDAAADGQLRERCRAARERLLRVALSKAGAYPRLIDAIGMPDGSIAHAASMLMLLFTERYYRHTAVRVGMPAWDGPESTLALLLRSLGSMISSDWARTEMARASNSMLRAATS